MTATGPSHQTSTAVVAGSALAFVLAWVLLLLDVEPVPTWFYVFAWYPTLIAADELAARAAGTTPMRRQPRLVASVLGWSVVIWLLFEAANFRLRNWYYVLLPENGAERWLGIVVSFATVVPAVVLAERLLGASRFGDRLRSRPVAIRPWELRVAAALGVAGGAAALGWPRWWFPLIWGAAWLLVDPWLYRRRPEWSLVGDVARGSWGRIVRLLSGGLAIGLLWESYNYWARGKWIYTVPGLESLKVFEMPPLGFLGFPVFALEAWTLYHALCALGVAVPLDGTGRTAPRRTVVAAFVAVGLSAGVLWGMERHTISSTVPTVAQFAATLGVDPDRLTAAAGGPRGLLDEARIARAGLPAAQARRLRDLAGLAFHRGLGLPHALRLERADVASVCALARRDPDDLYARLRAQTPTARRPTPAEVRVWVQSAVRRCDAG